MARQLKYDVRWLIEIGLSCLVSWVLTWERDPFREDISFSNLAFFSNELFPEKAHLIRTTNAMYWKTSFTVISKAVYELHVWSSWMANGYVVLSYNTPYKRPSAKLRISFKTAKFQFELHEKREIKNIRNASRSLLRSWIVWCKTDICSACCASIAMNLPNKHERLNLVDDFSRDSKETHFHFVRSRKQEKQVNISSQAGDKNQSGISHSLL